MKVEKLRRTTNFAKILLAVFLDLRCSGKDSSGRQKDNSQMTEFCFKQSVQGRGFFNKQLGLKASFEAGTRFQRGGVCFHLSQTGIVFQCYQEDQLMTKRSACSVTCKEN